MDSPFPTAMMPRLECVARDGLLVCRLLDEVSEDGAYATQMVLMHATELARRLLPNGQQLTHGAEILLQSERALGDLPARRLLLELGSPGHLEGARLIGDNCPVNTLTRAAAAATISGDTTIRRKRAGMEAAAGGVKVVGPKDGQEGFLGTIGVRFMTRRI
jgi:hypothetical protein